MAGRGHTAALRIAEYREHQRIVSTYGESFLAHLHPSTRRLHPNFRAIGATTGRASCAEPNLQSIPAGSEFRDCFRAPEGRSLITADYEGAELRILAQVSGDPVFLHTLLDGGDLHSIVASRLFNQTVSKEENAHLRARAKAINFGLAYGMGPAGLADQVGITEHEAGEMLERYFQVFPRIRHYLDEAAHIALRNGFARTEAGRTFWFTDMRNENRPPHALARVAKNMPIQGTNADIVKLAMARITTALMESSVDAFLVNMVHDEIVVEAASDDAEAAREIVIREMMSAGAEFVRRVPMTVDAQIGKTWLK
ncbi:MAG: DNA polymerase, partial [Myxococcota bacterium]